MYGLSFTDCVLEDLFALRIPRAYVVYQLVSWRFASVQEIWQVLRIHLHYSGLTYWRSSFL